MNRVSVPHSIERQVSATYLTLRVLIAVLAFALPPLLRVGGKKLHVNHQPSMSDYYWASAKVQSPPCKHQLPSTAESTPAALVDIPAGSMRNCFVGFLFAVGAMLFCYKGYSQKENWALNFAGTMAWGIALFPMDWICAYPKFDKHGTCAVLFFLAIAYVAFFRAKDTLGLIPQRRQTFYRVAYNCLAAAMVVAPASAWWLDTALHNETAIFWVELWAIYSFAAYWVFKIFEIQSIGSERRAIEESGPGQPAGNRNAVA